eukprot:CAMPEP_0197037206 /NCGR_PEP_ID=MMETSP1384-20130603/14470_1 /TAXON_ID=29189 /ORGANISM="Ammonia sp." /LENGTH=468 /DNA_ID=CAMNT_0042467475 /DNA_START=68 /DNA_END=1471 /DNA_ORIENTATION=+
MTLNPAILQPIVIPSQCGTIDYHYLPIIVGSNIVFQQIAVPKVPPPCSGVPKFAAFRPNAKSFQPSPIIDKDEEIADEDCVESCASAEPQDRFMDSYRPNCASVAASEVQSIMTENVTQDTEDMDNIEIDSATHATLATWATEHDVAVAASTPPPPPTLQPEDYAFEPRYNNRSKGNIFISKEMVHTLVHLCAEKFDTDTFYDERLMFGYFKERVALFIIAGLIRVWPVRDARNGNSLPIILLNIGLHNSHRADDVLYLICTLNDEEYREKVQWKVIEFMTKQQIVQTYGIPSQELPDEFANRRSFNAFYRSLQHPNFQPNTNFVPRDMIERTNFSKVAIKTSRRLSDVQQQQLYRMSETDLKFYLKSDWLNGTPVIPKQVNKGKREWREWEKFVQIPMNGVMQWIGVSLKYYESNRRWQIECLDFDAGRVYYQYKLIGERYIPKRHRINYHKLSQLINSRYILDKTA